MAQSLVLLYDGVSVSAQMDHNPNAAATARAVGESPLDAATASSKRARRAGSK